jgi:chemotaxis protein MotB
MITQPCPLLKSRSTVNGVAYLESTTRIGRSQGASIFWGLVSVFFAAAACYYYWENHKNETYANVQRDQVILLEEQTESLTSQKEKLQAGIGETESQLKTREEFLQDKETKLAGEESRLEALQKQMDSQSQQSQAQTAVVKKFNDTVRKLIKSPDTDVVLRGGRPVLRVPSSIFFDLGETNLKPDGKALLAEISKSLNGQLDAFELEIASYSDTEGEAPKNATTTDGSNGQKPDAAAKTLPKPVYASGWELTAVRAAVLSRYFRDETTLPFQNVVVTGRGDSDPIVPNAREGHARNRRIEITIAPLPPPFHTIDLSHNDAEDNPGKSPDKTPDREAEKSLDKTSDKGGKGADKSSGKTNEKGAEKNQEKAADKNGEKSSSAVAANPLTPPAEPPPAMKKSN